MLLYLESKEYFQKDKFLLLLSRESCCTYSNFLNKRKEKFPSNTKNRPPEIQKFKNLLKAETVSPSSTSTQIRCTHHRHVSIIKQWQLQTITNADNWQPLSIDTRDNVARSETRKGRKRQTTLRPFDPRVFVNTRTRGQRLGERQVDVYVTCLIIRPVCVVISAACLTSPGQIVVLRACNSCDPVAHGHWIT